MQQKHIRIGCVDEFPYINICGNVLYLCVKCLKRQRPGIEFEMLWAMIAYGMNVTYQDVHISLKKYQGYGDGTEEETSLFKGLRDNEVDITVPHLTLNERRLRNISYVFPAFMFAERVFIVNPIMKTPGPPNLFTVFDQTSWALGITVLIILSFSVALIAQYRYIMVTIKRFFRKKSEYSPNFAHNSKRRETVTTFDSIFGIVFENGFSVKWQRTQNRLLMVMWGFFSIVGLAMYSALYVEGFTPNHQWRPFTTTVEASKLIKERKYKFVANSNSINHMWMEENSTYKQWKPLRTAVIRNPVVWAPTFLESFKILERTRGSISPSSEPKAIAYLDRSPNSELQIIKDKRVAASSLYSWGVQKDSQFQRQLADGFMTMMQFGEGERLFRKYGEGFQRRDKITHKLMELRLSQLAQTFEFLVVGLVVAIFGFSAELCYARYKRKMSIKYIISF